jgi:cation transport regulator ChaB
MAGGRSRKDGVCRGAIRRAFVTVSAIGDRGTRLAEGDEGGIMPKMASGNRVKKSELPDTLQRSSGKAQRTFAKAHDSAAEQYGEGERAHRTAYAALKETHERKGDRWVAKDHAGPSDPRSKQPTTAAKRAGRGETYGGVDAEQNTKQELYARARRLGIEGRSKMSKRELARAIAKRQ